MCYILEYMHACIHACIGLHTYIHTCMHTYIHTYMHTYIHTCMHTYIHTCIHTYIHTLIHWYMACPNRYEAPSELCKLVPMREERMLCANYVQTMRELVVPMGTLIGTHSCTRPELSVNSA